MKRIWKQVVEPNSIRDGAFGIAIKARSGSVPLFVGKQSDNHEVCVWFTAFDDRPEAILTVYCVGTGFGAIPDNATYFGTVFDGPYVWHFFYTQPA